MLPKSAGSVVAEVVEILSDTELRIKREFGGESGKGTALVKEKLQQLREQEQKEVGLDFKKMPHIDQQETYRHVYESLDQGGCIVIFPEGTLLVLILVFMISTACRWKSRPHRPSTFEGWCVSNGHRRHGEQPRPESQNRPSRALVFSSA